MGRIPTDKKNFLCPRCKQTSLIKEWEETTADRLEVKVLDLVPLPMAVSGLDKGYFFCPKCGRPVDGHRIKNMGLLQAIDGEGNKDE